ncbi:MAG TPA: hypothetical protein VN539_06955 [Candidatus Saccharimonadales bacterium]|nr:hypothetical protein [Candidatus Saccharimonadales bacterium]
MSDLKALSIQVQPHRAPGLDIERLRALITRIESTPLVERSHFEDGIDEVEYSNFTLGTRDLKALWATIRAEVYGDPTLGELVSRSSIATCEGSHGWDDYLLLHHFDPKVRRDQL